MANAIARKLRKTMTRQEVKLWVHLRSWRQRGFHFRRQSPRDGFIVDFVCLKQKLVVEVDGGQHNFDDHAARDRMRDRHFMRRVSRAAILEQRRGPEFDRCSGDDRRGVAGRAPPPGRH